MEEFSVAAIMQIAMDACRTCGASPALASSLVEATLSAEIAGRREVGLRHLVDYLASLRDGRINGTAIPRIDRALPGFIRSDANGGIAQLGFDQCFHELVESARTLGISILTQRNSYTAGELGYYVRRLASEDLVSLAFANCHAMVAPAIRTRPAFGTNPIAVGFPMPRDRAPLIVDQAASATAFVNVLRSAASKTPLPEGWAIDSSGAATTDPDMALLGALLPFGGYKGANLALLVEFMSAGLSGAAWSIEAGNFRSGTQRPGIGLTVIAVAASTVFPGFAERIAQQVDRLQERGVHIPGAAAAFSNQSATIEIEPEVLASIRAFLA